MMTGEYFATHGLVSGDLERFAQSQAEPALVLTIPREPTEYDNGLLQAREIALLKLNADWVVLSACNTAADDKPGAEALSGLARAFFYAGARSLIVSHWEVDSNGTADDQHVPGEHARGRAVPRRSVASSNAHNDR